MTWHCAFDENKILIGKYFEYLQAAHFHALIAHLACHAHAFHYFSSEGGVTQRARRAESVVLTVCLLHDPAEAVAFYYALEAFTFGGADHADFIAFLEDFIYADHIAQVFAHAHVAKLCDFAFGRSAGLIEMADQAGRGVFYFTLAISELQGGITVGILRAHLRYYAGSSLDNRASNVFTVLVVDAGHADFFSNQTVHE